VNTRIIRIMARYGTFSPVVGAAIVGSSVIMTPGWTMSQSLIDLGSGGFSAVVFNSGLLMAGALAMLLAAGLFEYNKGDIVGQIGCGAYLGYAFVTCALGVVLIDLASIQGQLTAILFLLIPFSTALLSYSFYWKGLPRYVALGLVALVFEAAPWFLGGFSSALNELISLVPFGLWQMAVGLHLYRLKED
jgi:hypothetical membrane protein